jgi:predicted nucleotide-binding protein
MPTKTKAYEWTRFTADTIKAADAKVGELATELQVRSEIRTMTTADREKWIFDNDDQFFANYRKGNFIECNYHRAASAWNSGREMDIHVYGATTSVSISLKSVDLVERAFEVFEAARASAQIPKPPPAENPPSKVKVFLGHGRDPQWRVLRDDLQDKHGFIIEAYEVGSRAGHTIRDILDSMLKTTAFAVLLMTGEDATDDGNFRARQNVVHEAGLFQGRLGFDHAVVVVEEGIELFSNLDGIQYIPFKKNNIREAVGDIVAVLRREGIPQQPVRRDT